MLDYRNIYCLKRISRSTKLWKLHKVLRPQKGAQSDCKPTMLRRLATLFRQCTMVERQNKEAKDPATIVVNTTTCRTNAISDSQYVTSVISWAKYQECDKVTRLQLYPIHPNWIMEVVDTRRCMLCHRSKFWIREMPNNHCLTMMHFLCSPCTAQPGTQITQ